MSPRVTALSESTVPVLPFALWGVIVLASVTFAVAPTNAQTLRPVRDSSETAARFTIAGVVRDANGRAIAAAEIRIGSHPIIRTDSTGTFTLRDVPQAPGWLVVRRLGFDSDSVPVPASASPAAISVTLRPSATRLATVVVEGVAYDKLLWDNGFYKRQRTASGTFFDADFLDHFGGSGLGTLVREAPRIDVRRIGTQDVAFSSIGGAPCRMNVFIDGRFQQVAMPGPSGSEGLGLSELIGLQSVYAVEVYPRYQFVPTEFRRMGPGAGQQGKSMPRIPPAGNIKIAMPSQGENADAACGAIVIWTKPVVSTGP